jgi:hypothetical protein
MCKDLQNGERLDGFPLVEADGTATPSASLPSDNMLRYLQKSGASYVCLSREG